MNSLVHIPRFADRAAASVSDQMLFDLQNDPDELTDLGADPTYGEVIDRLYDRLHAWARRMSHRTAISDAEVIARRGTSVRKGVLLGLYGDEAISDELMSHYHGPARPLSD